MELYYSKNSAYPATLDELVTGEYLKTIPIPPQTVAALEPSVVAPALAADEVWALLAAGQPAFMVHDKISKEVCQELNYLARGSDAIYGKIDGKSYAQCFGAAEGPFTFVVGVPGSGDAGASLEKAVEDYNDANDPDLPIADAGGLTPGDVTVPATKNRYEPVAGGSDEDEDSGDGDEGVESGDLRFNVAACYWSSSVDDNGTPFQLVLCPDNLVITKADGSAFDVSGGAYSQDWNKDYSQLEDYYVWTAQLNNQSWYDEWYLVQYTPDLKATVLEGQYRDDMSIVVRGATSEPATSVTFSNHGNWDGGGSSPVLDSGTLPVQVFTTNLHMQPSGAGADEISPSYFAATVTKPITFTLTGNGLTSSTVLEYTCDSASDNFYWSGSIAHYQAQYPNDRWVQVPGTHTFSGGTLTVNDAVFPNFEGNDTPCGGYTYEVMFRVRDGGKTGVVHRRAGFYGTP
jgi:hypothetical protein